MDTREFFEKVFGDGEGRSVIVLPNYAGKPVKDYWFEYPAQLDNIVEFVSQNQTSDVWYSPILYHSDSRTKDNSKVVSVFAADADTCDPANFRTVPSIVVESSAGRYQVYWLAKELMDPHDAAKVNRRIAQVHKDQGCDTAYVNAAKLLRVPGTSNSKHPGDIVIVADVENKSYTIQRFNVLYPVSEVPDALDTIAVDMPDDVIPFITENRAKLLAGLPNNIQLRDMLFGKFHPDKRSDVRYKLLCELYRLGMDDYGVMAIAWDAPSNKYNGDDPRSYKGLWDEAMKAKADVSQEQGEFNGSMVSSGSDNFGDLPSGNVRSVTNFLTEEEEQLVKSQVNFIDLWIAWAATRTDAPKEYHRASAITVLSAVYSEFGHATPKFAKDGLKLNIWFMVLGRSTKDRKSTTRSFMHSMFRRLKTDEYNYELGDDVTPSGISLALHDRANKSSVFDRDEVQGLFKELLNQSYMSGGIEVFTKLYDGWSGGRIRATGDKKVQESVPVSFIMFMMGILTEATDVLTITNFRSGFLTRFLYVIGSRPEGWKSPAMEQSDEVEDTNGDPVFDKLVEHMKYNRNYWEMRKPDDKTIAIRAEDDAWSRLQEYEQQVAELAAESKYGEIIGTTSERMVISTLKLAALLAMDDRSNTIKLVHMLQAIAYAGEWYDNAITVASMVSESEWQRDVDKLEQFINSKGGQTTYAVAYRQFTHLKPKDFDQIVDALVQRGVLDRIQNGPRWILKISYEE